MKFKSSLIALASIISFSVSAQEISYAKVISATPIESSVQSYEPRQVCSSVKVPLYKDIPYQVRVETPVVTYRENRDNSAQILGMLIGAAIGNRVFSGDARLAGTFLGAAVGHNIGNNGPSYQTHVTTQSTYVTEYRKEFQGYTWQNECRIEQSLVHKNVITGYNVTYTFNGTTKNVVLSYHPGENVKIITTTTVVP